MTRLFLRFYLGVICILLMAFFIQSVVLRQRSDAKNLQVVEQALSGGVRLATDKLQAASPAEFDRTLVSIQQQFEYPVALLDISRDNLHPAVIERLSAGEVVFYNRRGGGFVAGALDRLAPATDLPAGSDAATPGASSAGPQDTGPQDTGPQDTGPQDTGPQDTGPQVLGRALEFGPLPSFVGPSQTVVTVGYGIVLLLAAVAIAILLRPVVRQLRAVEKTAAAIAGGDFSARVTDIRASIGLPLAKAFNTMADRTENLLRSQRELLQAVSHELRTPLARIRFATDLISSAATAEERAQRLAAVDRATQDLDFLVGELLTYVRVDAPSGTSDQEVFNLCEATCEELENRRPLYPKVTFRLEHPQPESGFSMQGDRISLSRAIGNLIGNAGKFANHQVIVQLSLGEDSVTVDVDDDGPGVPEEERQRIFEPFVRLPNSPGRGAGLGLALVARIVASRGGVISVSSSPLGGARFRLVLPMFPSG